MVSTIDFPRLPGKISIAAIKGVSFGASVLLLPKLLVNNAVCTGITSFFRLTYAQDVVEVVALAGVGTVLKGAVCKIWPGV